MTRLGMVINLDRCVGCYACSVGCAVSRALPKGDRWARVKEFCTGSFPDIEMAFVPTMCMQCANPACVEVCPVGATFKGEDGVVVIDAEICIGCGSCVTACPYDARVLVSEAESNHGEAGPTEHELAHLDERYLGTVEKCTFCADRRERGEEPLCVKTCVADARVFGDLDDPESAVAQAAAKGVQLLAGEGTDPSVFYIYSGNTSVDEMYQA